MSPQVTEAHLRLANQPVSSQPPPLVLATLIADGEVNATVERDQLLALLVYADQILDDIDTCSDAHKPMYSSYSQNVMKLCIKGREARRAVLDSDIKKEAVAALDQALDIAQAELATERARLDWLELRGPWDSWNGFGETGITLRENIRAAIDAAMKEETK